MWSCYMRLLYCLLTSSTVSCTGYQSDVTPEKVALLYSYKELILVPTVLGINSFAIRTKCLIICVVKQGQFMSHKCTERTMLHSPESRERRAEWQETRDEEQAVSMLSDGPVHPNVKETLPQATLLETPATTKDISRIGLE